MEIKVGTVLKNTTIIPDFRVNGIYPVVSRDFEQGKGFIYGILNDNLSITYFDDNETKWFFEVATDAKDSNQQHDIPEDNVNHPSHYTWLKDVCGVEPIDICKHLDFDLGNALKYILRAGHKKDASMSAREKTIEDLKKAIFYINDKIEMLKNEIKDKQ